MDAWEEDILWQGMGKTIALPFNPDRRHLEQFSAYTPLPHNNNGSMKNGMIQLSQWNSLWYLQAEYLLEVFLFGIRITCRKKNKHKCLILMWIGVPDIISISGLLWRDDCNPSVFGCSLSFYLVPTLIGMLSFKSRFLDSLLMSLLVFWISFSLFIEMNDFFQWRPRSLLIFTIWLG